MYTGSLFKDRLIEQLTRLSTEFAEQDFHIVGGPNKIAELFKKQSEGANLRNIFFHGHVSNHLIPLYLFASDILLGLWSSSVPTINYCSPLKIPEYMASGRLIVSHKFPSIAEVLNEHNSILVKPDSYIELKEKLSLALKELGSSVRGKNARKDSFKLYTWDKRVKAIINRIEKSKYETSDPNV